MICSARACSHRPIKSGNGLAANRKTASAAPATKKASDGVQLEKTSIPHI